MQTVEAGVRWGGMGCQDCLTFWHFVVPSFKCSEKGLVRWFSGQKSFPCQPMCSFKT